MRKRRHISVSLIILLIFTVLSLFPVYWTVTTAFKKPSQIMVLPPDFIPTSGTPDNFKEAFSEKHIGTFFGNSLLIAVATTLMTLLLASLAGYGYSRFRFKGRKSAMMLVIIVRMIPALIYMVPYYIIFNTSPPIFPWQSGWLRVSSMKFRRKCSNPRKSMAARNSRYIGR